MNRYFTKKGYTSGKYVYENISTWFSLKRCKYHNMHIIMAKNKKSENTICWLRCRQNINSYLLLMGMQNSTALLEKSSEVSYNAKHSLTIWSSNHTSRYLPVCYKNLCPHKSIHVNIHTRFIIITPTWKQQDDLQQVNV